MLLDHTLEKYPMTSRLKDGSSVLVRPIQRRDDKRLHKFLMAVPEVERLFIKNSIADRSLVQNWCRNQDFDQNLPLLMLQGGKIIGEATLHQRLGGWKRHIGLITLLTHPDYRGRDVSKILLTELLDISRQCGLHRLEAELNGERKIALNVLSRLGFQKLADLSDYVLDMQAVTHDYVLLGMSLKVDDEYAGVGD